MFSLLSLNPFSSTEKGIAGQRSRQFWFTGTKWHAINIPKQNWPADASCKLYKIPLSHQQTPPIVCIFYFALRLIFVISSFVSFGYDNIVLGAMELRIKTITVTHSHVFNNTYRRTDYQNVFTGAKLKVKTAVHVGTTGHSPVIYLWSKLDYSRLFGSNTVFYTSWTIL